jgi:hypothetical protein
MNVSGRSFQASIDLAAAVNDHRVLANCLGRSPDVAAGALPLRTYEGFASAGAAFASAFAESAADVLILAHQDVYLPAGFLTGLRAELARLETLDPEWAVAGVIGLDATGGLTGRTWSSGLRQVLGQKVQAPEPVVTLDELLLVVRRGADVAFDPELPGFHLYAGDIVQAARAQGLGAYVVDAPVIHHSRPVVRLDAGYRRAYRHMQKKWREHLPLPNLIVPIHRSGLALNLKDARIRWRHRGRTVRPEPQEDPAAIARRLGFERAD